MMVGDLSGGPVLEIQHFLILFEKFSPQFKDQMETT